ncbi:hypothetical protein M8C21_029408 [Ambrosia artemisiifolia]|uniref:Uncharacterized protein n=1 Tax=Ambrosia artemisiifolia TaxID=4212 RepID=A0AAD5G887_AMBAR|nr:hypothetical protein M8C21_029408 [Ambrosia artemisiifolia]
MDSSLDQHITCRFDSEVELGKFTGSTDAIHDAHRAILETNEPYKLHTTGFRINVLAFKSCAPDYTTLSLEGDFGLVPSEYLQGVDFIPTKVKSWKSKNKAESNPTEVNSSVSNNKDDFIPTKVNKAAVGLFQKLSIDLIEQEKKYKNTPLIITGSGLGGYLAILSALRLHHAIDVEESNGSKNTKRPICITFGCPLVGDEALQRAIAERPQWKYSFLNVVANMDPIATFFSSDTPYKPFGTFLFCTESGGHTAFEDKDSIMLVLNAIKLSNEGNLQIYDYTNVLSSIRRKVLYRGVSELGDFNLNPLKAGITLQLREVGVLSTITNDEIGKMEKKQADKIKKKNLVSAYDPTKKLNEMKISLTYMEWYMKTRKSTGGYYDSYKNPKTKEELDRQNEIVRHHRVLNQYWKKFVEDKDRMPQKEGAKLRTRWLLGGNNYRRIVEPLEIAEYYRKGNKNYIETNRSDHFKLLEKWLDEDKDPDSSEVERNKAASLTEDSCFWAHVEEALILLSDVNRGSADIGQKLEKFEVDLMRAINNYSLSPDVFLDGSSLMKWWDEYKAHKGSGYASEFAEYMNKESYRSYQ